MKLRKLLACGLLVITALSLCSCGKDGDKNGSGATNSGDDSNSNSHEGTYILVDEIIENNAKTFVLANENGTIKLNGYEKVEDFYNNTSVAQNENSDYGIIDAKGKEVVPFGKYKDIDRVNDYGILCNFFEVKTQDSKYGIIDNEGKEIVPCDYDYIYTRFFSSFQDKNGTTVSIPMFECKNDSDNVYDIYSRLGTKVISGCTDSNNILYFSLDRKAENEGVFFYNNEDTTKVDFISEKTGKSILTLNISENADYEVYISGLILYKNNETDQYEVYMTAADGTSATKIFDDSFSIAYVSDKYRIIPIRNSIHEEYNNKALIFDESGKLCHTVDNNGNFYIFGSGNNTTYFSQVDGSAYDVYDSEFKKTGQLYDINIRRCFYAAKTASNSPAYTIYDINSKVIYENAEEAYAGGYKIEGGKIIYSLGNSDDAHLLIIDENQEYDRSLNTGYALILTKDSTDSTKETYSIYDYNGKVCDIGPRFDKLCDNVNLYCLDDKYYNYEGKLIYEKKGNN